ncbi:acyl carrier protein [Chloroflexota bacterium]|jgi:acyl carrier protein
MPTLEHLREIMARVARCNGDEIDFKTALKDVKADSLHWLQIIIRVEGDFDIEIDFERMRDLTTIGDFVNYIDSCKS